MHPSEVSEGIPRRKRLMARHSGGSENPDLEIPQLAGLDLSLGGCDRSWESDKNIGEHEGPRQNLHQGSPRCRQVSQGDGTDEDPELSGSACFTMLPMSRGHPAELWAVPRWTDAD